MFEIWTDGKLNKFNSEREALDWLYNYRKEVFGNSALGLTCWKELMIDTDGPWTEEGQKELDHIIYAHEI